MTKMKKPRMTKIVSYLLVAAIGVAGGWWVKRGDAGDPVPDSVARVEKAGPKNGKDLLSSFMASSDPVSTMDERFAALRKSMAVSSDPAAEFQKKLGEMIALGTGRPDDEKRQMELAVWFGQWVDTDPGAALAYLAEAYAAGGLAQKWADNYLWRVAKNAVAEKGVSFFVGALPENPELFMLTSRSVFEDVAKRASLADLEWLKANAPGYFTDRNAGKNLAREWPVERRDELLAALDPQGVAAAVAGLIGRMDEGGDWVLQKLKNNEFPPEVVREMAAGDLGEYFRSINGVSIEQRLEIMGLLGTLGNIGEDRAKNEMIFNSIRNRFFGRDTDDSLYGLRHGTMTAAEVLARAVETMPDPGKHTGEYNSQMFRTMAEENLPAAMELLSDMPPEQQEKEKALAARWWFRDADPQDFFNLVQDLNATGDDGTKAMMQDAWNDKSRAYLDRYGASYLEWVRALPEGVDRTQALKSVAASGSNPRLAAQARTLLEKKP
jgi:hypothetical protein